jgi:hypothetical protein
LPCGASAWPGLPAATRDARRPLSSDALRAEARLCRSATVCISGFCGCESASSAEDAAFSGTTSGLRRSRRATDRMAAVTSAGAGLTSAGEELTGPGACPPGVIPETRGACGCASAVAGSPALAGSGLVGRSGVEGRAGAGTTGRVGAGRGTTGRGGAGAVAPAGSAAELGPASLPASALDRLVPADPSRVGAVVGGGVFALGELGARSAVAARSSRAASPLSAASSGEAVGLTEAAGELAASPDRRADLAREAPSANAAAPE